MPRPLAPPDPPPRDRRPTFERPRLIADIGDVQAQLALETAPGVFRQAASLRCADHADLFAAVSAYLAGWSGPAPAHAAVVIAGPAEDDAVSLPNHPWAFSIEPTRERLGLETLAVLNDAMALARALPRLQRHERHQVGGGDAHEHGTIGVLTVDARLGLSAMVPVGSPGDGWVAMRTEGGHASFSPHDERELLLLRSAMGRYGHVSVERLASGPGLEFIHRALAARDGRNVKPLRALEICRRGLGRRDALCREALEVFCGVLGTLASNLAVTLGAVGGIYIGGDIVPRLGTWFDRSSFRARFEDKGRLSGYLARIPVFVVTAAQARFVGASAILAELLRGHEVPEGSIVLGQIQRMREALPPAEKRVADHVVAHPRALLGDPIVRIAQAAGVSQPTVIRFCRSLGCEGLSDFKLRLAASLTGAAPVAHAVVSGDDNLLELAVKVLGNSAAAVLQMRDQLHQESLERAVELLAAARRVEFYAVGHDRAVAEDARAKFLHLGVPSAAECDPPLMRAAAALLRPRDVAVLVGSGGRADELLAVAEAAHACGATVLAVTAGPSPLARKADAALVVDHPEDLAVQLPMVSRLLHLLLVDVLAVGVAMRRGGPGRRGVLPLAQLSAHGG